MNRNFHLLSLKKLDKVQWLAYSAPIEWLYTRAVRRTLVESALRPRPIAEFQLITFRYKTIEAMLGQFLTLPNGYTGKEICAELVVN